MPTNKQLIVAAEDMDWQQVVLNGGPPCFHLEKNNFCGRAERWPGHAGAHRFISLAELLRYAATPVELRTKEEM